MAIFGSRASRPVHWLSTGLAEARRVGRIHGRIQGVQRAIATGVLIDGGLITDALAERLAPYKPYFVQVTLNGNERALHEAHVGGEHWDATLKGIATLRRAGGARVPTPVPSRWGAAGPCARPR